MAAETRWLERIVGAKQAELARTRTEVPQSVLEKKIAPRSPGTFRQALLGQNGRSGAQPELVVIAELKQASPSRGTLCASYDPAAIARGYRQAGINQVLREKLGPGSKFEKSLDLGHEESALAKLEVKLRENLEERTKEISALLNEIKGGKNIIDATTLKGDEFEKKIYPFIMDMATKAGDVPARVGTKAGAVRNWKVGDIEVELATDSGAPGKRIVLECKQDKSYDLKKSREELDKAKKNRLAQIGIFVYAKGYEPAEVGDFLMVDGDIYCTDGDSTVYLEAAYRIARATVVLAAAGPKTEFDLAEMKSRLARTTKAVQTLSELETFAETADKAIEKVLNGIRRAKKTLKQDLDSLEELLGA